jgi:hypothetical protein
MPFLLPGLRLRSFRLTRRSTCNQERPLRSFSWSQRWRRRPTAPAPCTCFMDRKRHAIRLIPGKEEQEVIPQERLRAPTGRSH